MAKLSSEGETLATILLITGFILTVVATGLIGGLWAACLVAGLVFCVVGWIGLMP